MRRRCDIPARLRPSRRARLLLASALFVLAPRPGMATFHLMQIEQVIGGVDGNTSVQAIQLRMRAPSQHLVQQARLVARDARGDHPVLLIDLANPVATSTAGARILIATANLTAVTSPPLSPDFVLASPIPVSYLAAGSIEFIGDISSLPVWRLSWGGAAYQGPGSGTLDNDVDGEFNPPFPGALPSLNGKALRFGGAASAWSTDNASDYQYGPGPATVTRNDGASAMIASAVSVEEPAPGAPALALGLGAPLPNPVRSSLGFAIDLPRPALVRVEILDLAGRRVAALVEERLPSGRHWYHRDGSALRCGVYLLRLSAGAERRTRRFVVAR